MYAIHATEHLNQPRSILIQIIHHNVFLQPFLEVQTTMKNQHKIIYLQELKKHTQIHTENEHESEYIK